MSCNHLLATSRSIDKLRQVLYAPGGFKIVDLSAVDQPTLPTLQIQNENERMVIMVVNVGIIKTSNMSSLKSSLEKD